MADAIVSAVAEQLISIVKEQIQNEIHLVRGVDKELLNLSDKLKTIRKVLDDAENRRFQDNNINHWLSRLEQTSYEMEDILDEWNYAILKFKIEHDQSNHHAAARPKQKVCSFIPSSSCLCFKKIAVRHDIAKKIQNVKAQLDIILGEKDQYNFVMSQRTDPLPGWRRVQSTSLIHLDEVQGRDFDRDMLVSKIISSGGSQDGLGPRVVSIVGVGGLGKTTLAQLVYNDGRVKGCFELRIWICVSDPFDEAGIAKEIISSVRKGSCPDTKQLDILLKHVIDLISGKKFLLVLDDVWTEDDRKWEPLKNSLRYGGVGSEIILTTRNEKVAKMVGSIDNDIYHLGQLSDEDCYMLLCRTALFGRNEEKSENFQEIGRKIAKKCKGLPLAAKALGSLLRCKNRLEEWENILNNEIWELEGAKVELFPHLLLSYNELSPEHKRCFSYCGVFPKDFHIEVGKLFEYWMVLGYLGSSGVQDVKLKGQECFDILAMHSLFQDFVKVDSGGEIYWCKMHDIVHDFAQFLRKNGRVESGSMQKTTCQACSPSLVSHVKEYRSLFWEEEAPPNLCDCLKSLRVLKMWCNLQTIPQGMKNLIRLRWLDLSYNDLSAADLRTIFQLYNLQVVKLDSCSLKEIPKEIGNLIHLRDLHLGYNSHLKEFPESISSLLELQTLNVDFCENLCGLPEGIQSLINLKYLWNYGTNSVHQFPKGLAQLTGLCSLREFLGGSGRSKLGLLKNLNQLGESLVLRIRLADDELEGVVEDAREAKLRKKIHIQELWIRFEDEIEAKEPSSSIRMDLIDALEPQPNLQELGIFGYKGSKLPGWLQTLNQLRSINLYRMDHVSSLPPLGKLPCLEDIVIKNMRGFQFLGREFLGMITTTGGDMNIESASSSCSSASMAAAFPKLKKLEFSNCPNWKEWEDITAEEEEEESAAMSLMPCLTELHVSHCSSLKALPHRLLRKLETLRIRGSEKLRQVYMDDKDTSPWNITLLQGDKSEIGFDKASSSGN